MTLSMYQASVPVFQRVLGNLRHVLQQGEAHATQKGVSNEVMLQTRLIPDMLPLVKQVQIATDMVKNGCARLAGVDPLPFPDDETTFEQLYARLDRCIEHLSSFRPEQIDGTESKEIAFATRTAELKFDGQSYLLHYVLPNLFFHATTAYAILRSAGAPLGKMDFLRGGN
ncbi:DUF1993 domain-containing protein [Lysobacter fragariae]